MANVLGIYDPIFYAQEALQQLEMNLGMASRVYRQLDKSPQSTGSVTKIRRPSSFTASAMPHGATVSDVNTETVTLTLDQWYGVTFKIDDLEGAYTRDRIIRDHIRPAAVAVANQIDLSLCQQVNQFPYRFGTTGGAMTGVGDLPDLQQVLFDNAVPMDDNWHLMLDGERTNAYQALGTFHQINTGVNASEVQTRGSLGKKLNFNIFSNQQVQTSGAGSAIVPQSAAVAANAAAAIGDTTLVIKDSADGTLTGTMLKGNIISVGGERYAVAADAAAGGGTITLTLSTPLTTAVAEDDAVTLVYENDEAVKECFGFHSNALALAMAPLPDFGNNRGAQISTVTDPITNLSLRARLWYDGNSATLRVGIDALWGLAILDKKMGVRYEVDVA